ncbi:MAG: HEAT repeat domain-containing protein [Phycisphaerae bacterium]|jgi:tetratricopeptide (TPR) repeat protein
MGAGRLLLWAVIGQMVLAGVGPGAAGQDGALPTAELLVDLARDHGVNVAGRQSPADVVHIETLLTAATRLDPQLAEAYAWLHELAVLRGDRSGAATAARQLLVADPAHVSAFDCFLDAGLAGVNTVEQRRDWLDVQLNSCPARPDFQAMVLVHAARLAVSCMDPATARSQVRRAVALDPNNLDAAALDIQLLEDGTPPAERLRSLLRFLRLSPLHMDTTWQIACLLDSCGYYEEAELFYEHAIELHRLANPQATLPGELLMQLSRHALARGDLEAAAQRASEGINADRSLASEGGMYLYWLMQERGLASQAEFIGHQLAQRFAAVREPAEWSVNEVAQAAWYHCTIDPQPQRALMLAENAAQRAPDDVFVTRVLGWAQLANLQAAQAERTLMPIAGQDVYAAAALARILHDMGEVEAADRLLREAGPLPTIGPVRDLLIGFGGDAAASQPTTHRDEGIPAILAEFDPTVLGFYREPAQFVEASISVPRPAVSPGEPWWLEFKLTNRASFPITLGPNGMINPVFLVSIDMEGDRARSYPYLLNINLTERRVLLPGETVQMRRTIDSGPPRLASRLTPQQIQRVTVRAILDPVATPDGKWQPGLGGQKLGPVYFNRLPAGTTREALRAVLAAFRGTSDTVRFGAVEAIAELLGESQRATFTKLNYRPEAVPNDRLGEALLAGLRAESWELRARTLDALQVAGLDATLLGAVDECLKHPHWLVRLMSVRLLGMRQGPAAAEKLRPLVEGDEDMLVRSLSGAFLSSWTTSPPTSQPAESEPND